MVESHNDNSPRKGAGSSDELTILPRFPVVGIGASAGGVKALQDLFEALPDQLNAAFVVIVHLDPNRQSELANILADRTPMPVAQVSDAMELEPNHVYVIPPNRRLVISDHEIATAEFDEPRGKRLPIDQFFRSMAEHRGDGVAIVLTGSGADGAIGIKAVKEAGGVILVQEPMDAEYSSMPGSAIATGVADFILTVPDIAARLVELLRSKEHIRSPDAGFDNDQLVGQILSQLRARTGHDFLGYKRSTVLRRLARRMQIVKADRLQDYLTYVRENVEELQALFSDLLISVTAFFRDADAFDTLARDVIPKIFDAREEGDCIRVWTPGCATGEEAYSIAMLLIEERARRDKHYDIQVFASDLDLGALATAREGRYPLAIEADVTKERLNRFFVREGDHYRVTRDLRDVVLFATHSLLRDPPFSRLDLVSCRNLLIYLDRDLQRQACNILAYGLAPGGYLFLGPSEGVDRALRSVRPVDRQARIFQVTERQPLIMPGLLNGHPSPSFSQPVAQARREHHHGVGLESHRQALEELAPPSILVDESHRIINVSESAGRFLLHPGGPPTTDVTELVRPELRLDLRAGLLRAFDKHEPSLSLAIPVQFNGSARQVYIQIRPQKAEGQQRLALVLFVEGELVEEPAASPFGDMAQDDGVVRQLREELNAMRVRLGDSRQQYGEAIEELRAANEELQSTNEEYRSTAEELETSKEELQSTNEELQTINNELKIKVDSLGRAYSDIQNLITSTDVGTLFLDRELRIRRFTPRIADLFNIAQSDEGRPITDFTHRLHYDGLASEAKAVLDLLTPVDNEIGSKDGRWFLARLRPYRSTEDKIEGVVITFVDITDRVEAEEALRQSQQRLETDLIATQQLHRISAELIHEQQVERLYEKLVEAAAIIMGSEYASMQMFHPERGNGGELQLLAFRGFNPRAAAFWEWVRADSKSTCGIALNTKQRVVVADVSQCDFMVGTEDLEIYLQTGIHAVQTTPLIARSGTLLGMISTHWREPREPSESQLRLLDLLAR
ncbi:MAG TPA: chemotaxis protein CheB, partial [Caulobacteraceae bacterium]